ncbi:methyl-accepting chemotaxis protein, partial [Paraburkholderia sp. SIMBA_049]
QKAASVQWVSVKSGNYYNEGGLQRKVTGEDRWLTNFLASGKAFDVNMDREVTLGGYMMFINSRVELDGAPIGAASMSLSVD